MKLSALVQFTFLCLLLAGCTFGRKPIALTPEVRLEAIGSPKNDTGYVLRLSNNSGWDMYHLYFLVKFSKDPKEEVSANPAYSDDLLVHNTLLKAGETTDIVVACEGGASCNDPGDYAGIYVCWSKGNWECSEYSILWTHSPIVNPR